MKCPNCNQDIQVDSQFCPFCGAKILISEPDPAAAPSKDSKVSGSGGKKTSLIIIIAVVALLAIAIAAYFLMLPRINYNKALKAMDEGRWSEARAILEKHDYPDGPALIDECYMHEYADYDFLRTLEKSLKSRLDNSRDTDIHTLIEDELTLLEGFADKKFYNKSINEQALKYIKGLKRQQASIAENDDHTGYYISDLVGKDEGLVMRYEAVKVLAEEFGLFSEDPVTASDCINYTETAKALLAIDKDLEDQLIGSHAEYNEKSKLYYLTFENRTSYEYDAVFYSSYLFGERLETDTISENGIRPGETVNLNLEIFTKETEELDAWSVTWDAYDIYKDGELLPD